ncbi:MAG: hypothetical protein AAF481_11255 [Acidobacteriota bacterium]
MSPGLDIEEGVAAYRGEGEPGAVRETALCLIGSAAERRAIRWLGTALYARALDQPPAPEEADRSLRPALRAAAKDLAALVGFLQDLSPHGEPCDATLATVAHGAAHTLLPVAKTLAEAAEGGPHTPPPPPEEDSPHA